MIDNDPFAAESIRAQQSNSQGSGAQLLGQRVSDPFTGASDLDDPFATPSELGGTFTIAPTLDDIRGRCIVLIPRKCELVKDNFDKKGEKLKERFTVDMTVFGGPFAFSFVSEKADPQKGRLENTYTEQQVTELPALFKGVWISQAVIVGRLKRAHEAGRPLIGVPIIAPTADARKGGWTEETTLDRYLKWTAAGRPEKSKPLYMWALNDPNADQRAQAVTWWRETGNKLEQIIPTRYEKN